MFILSLEVIDGFVPGMLIQCLIIVGRGEKPSGHIVLFGFLINHVHARLSFFELEILFFFVSMNIYLIRICMFPYL